MGKKSAFHQVNAVARTSFFMSPNPWLGLGNFDSAEFLHFPRQFEIPSTSLKATTFEGGDETMSKFAFSIAAAALVAAGSAAQAEPQVPIFSAKTFSGTGCGVFDGNVGGGDPDCRWHIMFKPGKDGEPEAFIYQDKGDLQPHQTAPSQTFIRTFSWSDDNGTCDVREVVTPAGEYSSYQICRAF